MSATDEISPRVAEVRFPSGADEIAATHHRGTGEAFARETGRPCVVMAHGFAGTSDSGLDRWAECLSCAGLDVLRFDYRHFGASGGQPRQVISPKRQVDDYRAAIRHARTLDGVDPDRIVVWGVSFSGGHVFTLGAEDERIAAVIALTPSTDGRASFTFLLRRDGLGALPRAVATGLRDLAADLRGRPRVTIPVVGTPGELAALTAPGAREQYLALAGPSFRDEVAARILLEVSRYRPIRDAGRVRRPVLVQVADNDTTVPYAAAMRAAELSRAEVRHLPCDHFDVHPGGRWFESAVRQQLEFLRRRL